MFIIVFYNLVEFRELMNQNFGFIFIFIISQNYLDVFKVNVFEMFFGLSGGVLGYFRSIKVVYGQGYILFYRNIVLFVKFLSFYQVYINFIK